MTDDWYFKVRGTKHFYWGVEQLWSESSRRRLSISWMQEMERPYRRGRGLRVRMWRRAYQIGVCTISERPPGRELPDVSLDQIKSDYQGVGHEIWQS